MLNGFRPDNGALHSRLDFEHANQAQRYRIHSLRSTVEASELKEEPVERTWISLQDMLLLTL